jgi:hypothetical protein
MNKKQIFIFAVMAIVIFALGAQLATAQPVELRIGSTTISFLPLIVTTEAAEGPSGVLYVFPSQAKTQGNPGGRSKMNDICPSEDSQAHFCRWEEIDNAWVTTGVYFTSVFTNSWVEYIPNLIWEEEYTNCSGWESSDFNDLWRIITQNAKFVDQSSCQELWSVACCKWIP